MSVPPLALNCSCSHLDVSHDIRGNGSRGACSISTGATAVPCGCKSFSAADDGALFDLPDEPERGGQHI